MTHELLTAEQLAAKLQRSIGTIYYWVHRREIPFERQGKQLRFDYEQVREHFRRKTEEESWPCATLAVPLSKDSENCSLKTSKDASQTSLTKKENGYGNS